MSVRSVRRSRMTASAPTGLIMTAGGARGAYQAGALAELLPILTLQGAAPTVVVGESVGALNAVVLAAHAHRTPQRRAEALLEHWAAASRSRVLRPLWQQMPRVALNYVGETFGVPGLALRGLLSVAPLRRMLEREIQWDRIHANLAGGVVETVAVTATAVTTGRSVTFVDRRPARGIPVSRDLDYERARLGVDHVMASAAIPALFPPVWVAEPAHASAWYVDGSTRLHTPLRPAIDLGAERLVIVGTTSLRPRQPRDLDHGTVDVGDTAVTLLHAMVEDSLRRDVARLAHVNAHMVGDGPAYAAIHELRDAQGKPPYRTVPFIAIAPDDPYEIGDLALQIFRSRYSGWRALRDPDLEIMHRLLGSDSPLQGEVLSFVLFDEVFHRELIARGRRDARAWLDEHSGEVFRTTLPESLERAQR